MKHFSDLYTALDQTTKTSVKTQVMAQWLSSCDPAEGAWAVWFLMGNRPKRLLGHKQLREWVSTYTGLHPLLVEDCYSSVGDLAETIALLIDSHRPESTPSTVLSSLGLHNWMQDHVLPLRSLAPADQYTAVTRWWTALPIPELFVLNKLLTGAFRVGVSRKLVERALSVASGVDEATLSHRLMGDWTPSGPAFSALFAPADDTDSLPPSQPYPFYLATPVVDPATDLGDIEAWQLEWKWDGIRGQLIRRDGQLFIWSRGEELITERFPDLHAGAAQLPEGTVLDGEILVGALTEDGEFDAAPFSTLQRRLNRKKVGKKLLLEAPIHFMAYDLLEQDGQDLREKPLHERAERLKRLLEPVPPRLHVSPTPEAHSWEEALALRSNSRQRQVEGLMLKRRSSPYRVGRPRGDWWKWKIDPLTIDAVLVNGQSGHGKRANLVTDYTFSVWRGTALVPVAKAYSGLDNTEIAELDSWIRRHTLQKFGPVRLVPPTHVFELAFDSVQLSSRHKAGLALRFPRIARWRRDKGPADANTLEQVEALLSHHSRR